MSPTDSREPRAHPFGGVIPPNRPCRKCGYDLAGLRYGGRCPECGSPIHSPRASRFVDNLTDAPVGYLKVLFYGMALLSAGAMFTGVSLLVFVRRLDTWGAFALAGSSLVWWIGLFIVTMPRAKSEHTLPDAVLDSARLRQSMRIAQGAWIALGMVALLIAAWATAPSVVPVCAGVLGLVGLFGLVPVAVYLASIADWASDTGLGGRLRGAAWAIAFCGGFAVLSATVGTLTGPIRGLVLLVGLWATGIAVLALIVFVFSTGQLALLAHSAVESSLVTIARDTRLADRAERHREEMARRSSGRGSDEGRPEPPKRAAPDEPIPLADDPA